MSSSDDSRRDSHAFQTQCPLPVEILALVLMGAEAFDSWLKHDEDCHRVFLDAERGMGGGCNLAVVARSVCHEWKRLVDPVCSPTERTTFPVNHAAIQAAADGHADLLFWIWKHTDDQTRGNRWVFLVYNIARLTREGEGHDRIFDWWLQWYRLGPSWMTGPSPLSVYEMLCMIPEGPLQIRRLNQTQDVLDIARAVISQPPGGGGNELFCPSGASSIRWVMERDEGLFIEPPLLEKFGLDTAIRNYDIRAIREMLELGVPVQTTRGTRWEKVRPVDIFHVRLRDVPLGNYEFYAMLVNLHPRPVTGRQSHFIFGNNGIVRRWIKVCNAVVTEPSQMQLVARILSIIAYSSARQRIHESKFLSGDPTSPEFMSFLISMARLDCNACVFTGINQKSTLVPLLQLWLQRLRHLETVRLHATLDAFVDLACTEFEDRHFRCNVAIQLIRTCIVHRHVSMLRRIKDILYAHTNLLWTTDEALLHDKMLTAMIRDRVDMFSDPATYELTKDIYIGSLTNPWPDPRLPTMQVERIRIIERGCIQLHSYHAYKRLLTQTFAEFHGTMVDKALRARQFIYDAAEADEDVYATASMCQPTIKTAMPNYEFPLLNLNKAFQRAIRKGEPFQDARWDEIPVLQFPVPMM